MSEPPLKVSSDQGVVRWTLNRPEKRNAFDGAMLEALVTALDTIGQPRALVIRGAGPVFCAGADIEWMRAQADRPEEENRASAEMLARFFLELGRVEFPVLAVVRGACLGGGLGLVAAADVAVAARDTIFAASEVRLGILPAVIGPLVLRKIGFSAASELFLSGRRIEAGEARDLGLVHGIAEPDTLEDRSQIVLDDLRKGSPQAQRRIKRYLRWLAADERPDRSAAAIARHAAAEIAEARASEDGREGLTAFLQKRPPSWL